MPLLEVIELDKQFAGNYALQNVSLQVMPGEVHALVGENGAGKSTFIKIVTGVYRPDKGKIIWQGREVEIPTPRVARELGICVIHQERYLIPSFSGAENIFLGEDYPRAKWWPGIKWNQIQRRAELLMNKLGIDIPLNVPAKQLTPPERTLLEIIRAMMRECKLLFLDEPTAALTEQETELLFRLIHRLREQGTAIIYVSHRLDEIFKLADRITVLRNGTIAGTLSRKDADHDKLISLMTAGAAVTVQKRKQFELSNEPVILEVKGLQTFDGKVKDASFKVHRKEIVGIFGLTGAGRSELLETIYGLRQRKKGTITVNGNNVEDVTPNQSLKNGVVLIPEDRRAQGLIMGMSIRENVTLPTLSSYTRAGIIKRSAEGRVVGDWIDSLKIKTKGLEQGVGKLSGGNQQKVVFARALISKPCLFLCDEPTQAVDVMTREEIHRLLGKQAEAGSGLLYVSSDLQELLEVSDRLLIMHEGKIVADLPVKGLTSDQALKYCYRKQKEGGSS
jgi:ribose transport system ATP-binding protein